MEERWTLAFWQDGFANFDNIDVIVNCENKDYGEKQKIKRTEREGTVRYITEDRLLLPPK